MRALAMNSMKRTDYDISPLLSMVGPGVVGTELFRKQNYEQ